jgi:hypothetical protein
MRQIFIVMHSVMVIVFDSSMCVYVCVLIVGTNIGHVKVMNGVWLECVCVCVRVRVCVCVLIVGSNVGHVKVMVFDSSVCVCVLTVGSSIGHVNVLMFDTSMCVCVCVDRRFKHWSRQGYGVWLEYVCVCVCWLWVQASVASSQKL